LLAPSPSSQRAGLDSGCAGKKTYPWVGDYFLGALKSHLATCAFSPFATTISPSACPIHAAADLMAPALSAGMLVGVSTAPAGMPQPCGLFSRWQSNLAVIDLPQIWNPWTFLLPANKYWLYIHLNLNLRYLSYFISIFL
jgi:hypothetical protein